ncbi:MAG: ferritin family protein [Candidatus Zixiibacteriota bacterium]|nr:MAG: ferritin family protein [candidate division Zixibacteria bacterium]
MTDHKNKIAEILKLAIKGEEDGCRYYGLLAEKATNEDARRKLLRLRDDELRHRKTLTGMYAEHVGGEIGELPAKGITPLAEVFSEGNLDRRKTEMEFINLAIEAELAATRFYQRQHEAVDDPGFRSIFEQLADEEHRHYELLQAEKEALSGNYYWFEYGDTSPLED